MLQSCTCTLHMHVLLFSHTCTYMYVHRMLGPSQALLDKCKDDIQQLKVCKSHSRLSAVSGENMNLPVVFSQL